MQGVQRGICHRWLATEHCSQSLAHVHVPHMRHGGRRQKACANVAAWQRAVLSAELGEPRGVSKPAWQSAQGGAVRAGTMSAPKACRGPGRLPQVNTGSHVCWVRWKRHRSPSTLRWRPSSSSLSCEGGTLGGGCRVKGVDARKQRVARRALGTRWPHVSAVSAQKLARPCRAKHAAAGVGTSAQAAECGAPMHRLPGTPVQVSRMRPLAHCSRECPNP